MRHNMRYMHSQIRIRGIVVKPSQTMPQSKVVCSQHLSPTVFLFHLPVFVDVVGMVPVWMSTAVHGMVWCACVKSSWYDLFSHQQQQEEKQDKQQCTVLLGFVIHARKHRSQPHMHATMPPCHHALQNPTSQRSAKQKKERNRTQDTGNAKRKKTNATN